MTPPGWWHSHHNLGDQEAWVLPIQDAGLYTHQRTLDIRFHHEEMGRLQERITSTKVGSITSIQAVYVPADDLTDPSPATTFAHLDATVVLSRDIASAYR